jgi:hypothetical protein
VPIALPHLREFREHVLTLSARRNRKGEGRKAKGRQTDRPLSGQRKKAILKATAALLRAYAPLLPPDSAFATRRIKVESRGIEILRNTAEVRQVLEAALRYDGGGEALVAPMVLVGLLSGFRGMDFEKARWEHFEPKQVLFEEEMDRTHADDLE